MYQTKFHRDGTVTVWDVYSQGWVRTSRPSDRVLASLDELERARVIRHCDGGCASTGVPTAGKRRYFAGFSAHGSRTSRGFDNDWIVYAFSSRSARDAFVVASDSTPVRRTEVTNVAANWCCRENREIRPRPHRGEYWGLVDTRFSGDVPGYIGTVMVCTDADPVIERL